ncbi:MAG: helix-turn-helix transcriptional regulator [Oscillospiraceae bacterium]|jgi:transcriptional regulator with XRE-family HTH domain|nr:helix-turn-helix transcriptional regulator [Oscillospiraceae bacterium]
MFIFGEHLRNIRKSRHLTQKQLAINIGASERGIQQYELGERKPAYDMLIALADYFDVSLDYLVGRSDDPTRH